MALSDFLLEFRVCSIFRHDENRFYILQEESRHKPHFIFLLREDIKAMMHLGRSYPGRIFTLVFSVRFPIPIRVSTSIIHDGFLFRFRFLWTQNTK